MEISTTTLHASTILASTLLGKSSQKRQKRSSCEALQKSGPACTLFTPIQAPPGKILSNGEVLLKKPTFAIKKQRAIAIRSGWKSSCIKPPAQAVMEQESGPTLLSHSLQKGASTKLLICLLAMHSPFLKASPLKLIKNSSPMIYYKR